MILVSATHLIQPYQISVQLPERLGLFFPAHLGVRLDSPGNFDLYLSHVDSFLQTRGEVDIVGADGPGRLGGGERLREVVCPVVKRQRAIDRKLIGSRLRPVTDLSLPVSRSQLEQSFRSGGVFLFPGIEFPQQVSPFFHAATGDLQVFLNVRRVELKFSEPPNGAPRST